MVVLLIVLIILLAATALFSGAETALFSLSRHDLSQFRRDKRRSYQLVAHLMEHPRQLLLTLMIGNVTINMFVFATSLALLERLPGRLAQLAYVLGMVSPVVLTLVADVMPKGIAILSGKGLAAYIAPFVRTVQIVLAPVSRLLDAVVTPLTRLLVGGHRHEEAVTVEELQQLVEMSQRRRIIDADENAMLSEALELNRLKVRDIMVHRTDMIAFEIHDDPDELKRLLLGNQLSKIPVYEQTIDNIIGLIYAKEVFLHRHRALRQLIHPVHFVPEIIRLTQLLSHFRRTRTQMAIAVDEFGGVTGLVTVEDVARQIVGELAPGEDETPLWERIGPNRIRVSGRMSIRDWAERFHARGLTDDVTTLGGLILTRLGRPAVPGDRIQLGNLILSVESLRGRRIEWIVIELDSAGIIRTGGAA
jgi:CBS domain containing-hemolysin-like protein